MRRGGPHPCLPGVPFVILTLHSGMEGETARKKYREKGRESACADATHTRRGKQKERSRQKKCCTRRLCTHVRLRAFVFLRVCAGSYSFRFMPFMHASMLER